MCNEKKTCDTCLHEQEKETLYGRFYVCSLESCKWEAAEWYIQQLEKNCQMNLFSKEAVV